MSSGAVIDANLLLLLVVGRAGPVYIGQHKRLRDAYTPEDFGRLDRLLRSVAAIVVVPHVLAEVSNLARHIAEPARAAVMAAFRRFIAEADERLLPSASVVDDLAFRHLGLTDAILLRLCADTRTGRPLTLVTVDRQLAARAQSLGCSVLQLNDS